MEFTLSEFPRQCQQWHQIEKAPCWGGCDGLNEAESMKNHYLSISLSLYLSTSPSLYLSVSVSISRSLYLSTSISLSYRRWTSSSRLSYMCTISYREQIATAAQESQIIDWSIGVLVYWSIGILIYWSHWSHWSIGLLVSLVHWSIGLLVYWSIGLLVYWSIGEP